ncbi:MAG TPA: tetratricopeptide repeat protein [Hanamia sp.]|nr:tetratricopeptide repeat protein [Hanamia sp.]
MKFLVFTLPAIFVASFSFCQNTDSAQFYFNKGTEANAAKLYAVASNNFDKAIHFNSNFTQAYIESGKVNLSMRVMGKAFESFSKAYDLDPKNNEVINELAVLSFNNHQYQKAIEFAQKCTSCNNSSRILGMSYYQLEDFGKAEKYLKVALLQKEQDADAAYTLGRIYLELDNFQNAIVYFQKAVELQKSNQWMYELGLIYYNQNDYKNALKYFESAANNGYNKSNDFYENYGFAQLYTGDTENGMKTLNIVLEHKPNNRELLTNIAYAMYDTKKYNEALQYFSKALEINPKDAVVLYMSGMTFQKLGEKEKGQKLCDSAISMDPSLKRYRQKNEIPMGL